MFVLKYIHQASVPSSALHFLSIRGFIRAAPDTLTICTADLKKLTRTSLQEICAVYLGWGIDASTQPVHLADSATSVLTFKHTKNYFTLQSLDLVFDLSCCCFLYYHTLYHHITLSYHWESVIHNHRCITAWFNRHIVYRKGKLASYIHLCCYFRGEK